MALVNPQLQKQIEEPFALVVASVEQSRKRHWKRLAIAIQQGLECLAEFLGLNHDLLRSVVFFIGDAQLRTTLPGNVLTEGLSSYIKSFTRPVLTPARVVEIEDQLQALTAGSTISRSEHLQSLDRRRESVTTCPKCGGELIKRLAKRGAMARNGFYGCANYPRCRYTKNA